MNKRITFLERRADLQTSSFRTYWQTTHAQIAVDLPRVVSYRQNYVVRAGAVASGAAPYSVDGIVELWFADEDAAGAGFGSDVADRLIADEPNFLSGLTGSAYVSGEPTPEWSEKLWVLAQRGGSVADNTIADWVKSTADAIRAVGFQINTCVAGSPVLKREALRFEADLPEFAIAFGRSGVDEVEWSHMVSMLDRAVADGMFVRAQLLHVQEVRII